MVIDIFTFLSVFCLTALTIFMLRPMASILGLMDKPSIRKDHLYDTPLVGGLAIYLATFITINVFHIPTKIVDFFIPSLILIILGILDDKYTLRAFTKLLVQISAALIMVLLSGLTVDTLGDLLGMGDIELGVFAIPFTVFSIVGLINAFNMLDGLDGLAGSISFVTFLILAFWANFNEVQEITYLASLLMFATGGFLIFNLRLAKRKQALVFMGNAGSMFLGFSFAWLVISLVQSNQESTPPIAGLFFVALPVLDALIIMLRRTLNKRSIFKADKEHSHHILLHAKLSVNQIILVMSCGAVALASFGILGSYFRLPEAIMFLVLIIIFLTQYFILSYIRKVASKDISLPISQLSRSAKSSESS